jgi:hypothetical protein
MRWNTPAQNTEIPMKTAAEHLAEAKQKILNLEDDLSDMGYDIVALVCLMAAKKQVKTDSKVERDGIGFRVDC